MKVYKFSLLVILFFVCAHMGFATETSSELATEASASNALGSGATAGFSVDIASLVDAGAVVEQSTEAGRHHHHHHHHHRRRRHHHAAPARGSKTVVVNIPVNKALQAQTKTAVSQRGRLATSHSHGRKHALNTLKAQYNAAERAFRSSTPRVLSKLNANLRKINARNAQKAYRHRMSRITHSAGVHYKNLLTRLRIAQKHLAHARRSRIAWKRRIHKANSNRNRIRKAYRKINYSNLKSSQSTDLAMAKFDHEVRSVRRAAKKLGAYKKQLEARAQSEADRITNNAEVKRMKAAGYDVKAGRYVARFQPEADGSHAKTRPLELGKEIDPESHAKGLIEKDYAADFGSINRASTLNKDSKAGHIDVRNNVQDILMSATYDVSNSRVTADVASFVDAGAVVEQTATAGRHHHHHHHHHHRRHRHHRRRRVVHHLPPIIHRIVNNPNPAISRAAATSARTFTSSEKRLDSDYHKARADLLRIHHRNMARLRAQRAHQVRRLKINWRKKVLKYNHHPKPSNGRYRRSNMNKLRRRIHKINAHTAKLRRSIHHYKSSYRTKARSFDASRVRNTSDFKEENSKIGTLMKKLHRAKHVANSVSHIMDRFD